MAKTFVPQLLAILKRFCTYVQKHHATLAQTLSPSQMAALDLMVSTCNTAFGSEVYQPQP